MNPLARSDPSLRIAPSSKDAVERPASTLKPGYKFRSGHCGSDPVSAAFAPLVSSGGTTRTRTVTARLKTATTVVGWLLTLGATVAAERREWVTVTNCHYVATKDGDGDSFRVRSGTNDFIVRLYFVDTPETNMRYAERNRDQAEHFGITLDETVPAGVRAKEVTRALLREPFTVRTRWASAAGGGREPRYYSFVDVGTNSLAALLVAQGWARTKGVTATIPGQNSKDFAARLRGLEAEAQQQRLGIWAMAHPKKTEPAEGATK